MWLCTLFRIFVLASVVMSQPMSRPSQRGQSRETESSPDDVPGDCGDVCESEIDLVFILDDSNSIAEWQFDIMKDFVEKVITTDVEVGEGQVAIIQFDDDSNVRCDLGDSLGAVEDCLGDTVYTDGGLTNIEAAIIDAIAIGNQRRGVPKVMVLMTDGDPTAGGDPVIIAEEAKADGWEIFTIGIGNVSEEMLRRIATDDDHVFLVEQFEDLEGLVFSVCVPVECVPCEDLCSSVVDVVFVLDDSNSIAEFEFDVVKEFIALVALDLGVGDDAANIGIVQFDDTAEIICDCQDNEDDVMDCLDDTQFDEGGLTNIADGLEKAKMSECGRRGVPQVIVLVTDGEPTIGGDPQPVADMAKDEGWIVFAIGIGDADLGFLEDLASEPEFVFLAEDFDDLLENVFNEFEICVPSPDCGLDESPPGSQPQPRSQPTE